MAIKLDEAQLSAILQSSNEWNLSQNFTPTCAMLTVSRHGSRLS